MSHTQPKIELSKALLSRKDAQAFVQSNKQAGKKVVFTNGCFDILHAGHVQYLNQAKALGDVLIIGLNADASVRRLKGEKRPINSEEDRAFVLNGLKAVDAVVVFEEDTPLELIQALLPDVLVKGGDWAIDKIVGREVVEANGGKVKTISFLDGRSTTGTIEKILIAYK
ncbi:rfaE bifunctional protein [Chloroherpeton thalassium ATCC 35110]|uniref:D-glycero-beta-D-manno-heptose 1-phosphate adenylyltransferase n=1 Tax=Chloroherpeton thalassium (strain ATCC 35110 / GB-78) TaxID=517418 RepID=B3QUE4_CHLT3|nr:D-glycero-beta-D-manno-heptose 1-phosphate adenylyltransferase [Chloroherpeton thalassium]ACF14393.1 rfaE bifunctional protein [Chloroherpeton thalassium ATCC 35110]